MSIRTWSSGNCFINQHLLTAKEGKFAPVLSLFWWDALWERHPQGACALLVNKMAAALRRFCRPCLQHCKAQNRTFVTNIGSSKTKKFVRIGGSAFGALVSLYVVHKVRNPSIHLSVLAKVRHFWQSTQTLSIFDFVHDVESNLFYQCNYRMTMSVRYVTGYPIALKSWGMCCWALSIGLNCVVLS